MDNGVKKVIIPGRDMVALIERHISNRVGVVASILNIKPILEVMLDHTFYGDVAGTSEAVFESISSYGIPSDITKKIMFDIFNHINTAILQVAGQVPFNSSYDYRVDNGNNIIVEIYPSTGVLDSISPPPQASIDFYNDVTDDDSYYPERMRREHELRHTAL